MRKSVFNQDLDEKIFIREGTIFVTICIITDRSNSTWRRQRFLLISYIFYSAMIRYGAHLKVNNPITKDQRNSLVI